jgi:hypothetical protein
LTWSEEEIADYLGSGNKARRRTWPAGSWARSSRGRLAGYKDMTRPTGMAIARYLKTLRDQEQDREITCIAYHQRIEPNPTHRRRRRMEFRYVRAGIVLGGLVALVVTGCATGQKSTMGPAETVAERQRLMKNVGATGGHPGQGQGR